METYRHGDVVIRKYVDVVIRKIDTLPNNLKRIETKPLAFGEETGHSHRVKVKDPDTLQMFEDDKGHLYFSLGEKAEVVHEEHDTIPLKEGVYTTRIIREYDYIEETINKVKD